MVVIIGIVVAVVLAGGAYVYLENKKDDSSTIEIQQIVNSDNNITGTIKEDKRVTVQSGLDNGSFGHDVTGDVSINEPSKDFETYTNNQYGLRLDYPSIFAAVKNGTGFLLVLENKSKDFPNNSIYNKITVSVMPAKGTKSVNEYLAQYPIINGNTNKPFSFTERKLGSNTFYYAQTERFEGTLSFRYLILKGDNIFDFSSISEGVAWTDPNLDVENDSTHSYLKGILTTLWISL